MFKDIHRGEYTGHTISTFPIIFFISLLIIHSVFKYYLLSHRLLDSLMVECWLQVLEVYQRRYKNGTGSSLVWHSTLKMENTGSF